MGRPGSGAEGGEGRELAGPQNAPLLGTEGPVGRGGRRGQAGSVTSPMVLWQPWGALKDLTEGPGGADTAWAQGRGKSRTHAEG